MCSACHSRMLGGMPYTDCPPVKGTVMRVRYGSSPSTGRQVALSVVLLVIDLAAIAWLVVRYTMMTWADGLEPVHPPRAPKEALRGTCLLAGGAIVTGCGLLALRWRIPGVMQLVVLGIGAGAGLISFAARE